jgi:hypothetical protein
MSGSTDRLAEKPPIGAESMKEDNPQLFRIPLRMLLKAGIDERITLICPEEVLFFFTAKALSFINAPWRYSKIFIPGRVYARTATGIFLTTYRNLAQALSQMDRAKFKPIHKSLLVNLQEAVGVDSKSRIKQIGVLANGSTEWLAVSRRRFKELRPLIGV